MSQLVRGPWDVTWGANTLTDLEEISVDYEQDSEDYTTLQHQTYELDGPIKASVTLTLLATDVAALAAVLPQYHVPNGGILSTGETVNEANGAIDLKAASCEDSTVYHNLDVASCGNPGQVFRLTDARTRVDSIEFDDKIRKVMIKFLGEPAPGEANAQFFTEGTISVVS